MRIEIPKDSWGLRDGKPVIPRKWQAEALPVICNHYSQPNPNRGCVYGVTGSGKAILISQLAACIKPDNDDAIVISTSTRKLVRQIRETVKERLEGDEFMADEVVGSYFTDSKDIHNKVIVCCNDSMGNLADALAKIGRHCCFWIADEVHKSECKSMKDAYDKLMPQYACGFSATPFRANAKQGISNFDSVIVKYGVQEALADKVIVPWVTKNWDGGETSLDDACLQMMKEWGTEGKGIVNAVSIADAEAFAKFCCDNDYSAKAVHSKLTDKQNDDIIKELCDGQIKAIVHVDLLTEGIDIPKMLFLAMRRVVGSRNRFVQELGRGVRYYKDPVTGEEKTHLTVLDFHDLFGVFKFGSYEAVLSGDFDPDDPDVEEDDPGKKLERTLQQECFTVMKHLTAVKCGKEPYNAQPLASYLSNLCSVFDAFGLMEKPLSSRDWRRAAASEKQIKTMQNLKWSLGRKQVPSIHRNALEILTTVGQMNRGMASDLISIEMSLAEKSTWPKFSQLDQCVKDGLERHAKKKLNPNKPRAVLAPPGVVGPKLEQGMLFEGVAKK